MKKNRTFNKIFCQICLSLLKVINIITALNKKHILIFKYFFFLQFIQMFCLKNTKAFFFHFSQKSARYGRFQIKCWLFFIFRLIKILLIIYFNIEFYLKMYCESNKIWINFVYHIIKKKLKTVTSFKIQNYVVAFVFKQLATFLPPVNQ